jgi:hypothetical protein
VGTPNTGRKGKNRDTYCAELCRGLDRWRKFSRQNPFRRAPFLRRCGGLDQRVLRPGTCRFLRRFERRTSVNTTSSSRYTYTIAEAYQVRADCACELVKVEREDPVTPLIRNCEMLSRSDLELKNEVEVRKKQIEQLLTEQ